VLDTQAVIYGQFGCYKLVSLLSETPCARIFLALSRARKHVVVKAIRFQGLESEQQGLAQATFRREVEILASLRHPDIPGLVDTALYEDYGYIVMEHIDGETLASYKQRCVGRLPLEEVLFIGIQLCDVLSYLHTQCLPVVHRDIKPANVMRSQDGHLTLVDFGAARRFSIFKCRDTQLLGTPGYAAPESYGEQQSSPQSDLYSLGILLYELWTGHEPPCAEEPARIPILCDVGVSGAVAFAELLRSCTDWQVERRPASAAVVKWQLLELAVRQDPRVCTTKKPGQAHYMGSPRKVAWLYQASRWPWRSRVVCSALVRVGAVIVVMLVLVMLLGTLVR